MRTDIKYTYEDYAALPEGAPYQLIEGELVMSPAPTVRHQRIIGNLYWLLTNWVRQRKTGMVLLAPVDVILSNEDTVQPDLVFVSNTRRNRIAAEGIRGGPDLCVEVLSPHSREMDRRTKRKLYARHEVLEYWIVDPEPRTIELYRLAEDIESPAHALKITETLASPLFPGLALALEEVFAD
jgi:Uma2 family endonuclease